MAFKVSMMSRMRLRTVTIASRGSTPPLYFYFLLLQLSCKYRLYYFSYASIYNKWLTFKDLMPQSLTINTSVTRKVKERASMMHLRIGVRSPPLKASCNLARKNRVIQFRAMEWSSLSIKMSIFKVPWTHQSIFLLKSGLRVMLQL